MTESSKNNETHDEYAAATQGDESPAAPLMGREAGVAVRWNGAAAAVTMVAQLAQILVLARWLSPESFGAAAAALAVTMFLAGLADLGLTNALVHRDSLSAKAWASAWWSAAAAGAGLFLILLVAASFLESGLRVPGLAPLLVVAAIALPLSGTASIFQAHLQRHLQMRRLALVEIVAAVAGLAVALAWAWNHRTPMALVAGQVALALVRFAGLGFASSLRPAPRLRWSELRPVAGYSGFQLAERVAAHALGNLDRLLVARLLGPAAAGYYFMASQIAFKPIALFGPFTARTLMPLLARIRSERARMASSYLRALSLLALPAGFVCMVLLGLADPLLALVLGPGWEPVVPVLRWLCVAGYLMTLGNALGNLALALGKAGAVFWTTAGLFVARFGALAVGARFGLQGAAAALLAVTVLSMVVDYILPRWWLGVGAGALTRAGGWPIVPAAAGAAVMIALVPRLPVPPLVQVLVAGAAGTAVFFGVAHLLHGDILRTNVRELADKLGLSRPSSRPPPSRESH